jgi:C4-dicarboxylate-specific signal transduction histidine kinase
MTNEGCAKEWDDIDRNRIAREIADGGGLSPGKMLAIIKRISGDHKNISEESLVAGIREQISWQKEFARMKRRERRDDYIARVASLEERIASLTTQLENSRGKDAAMAEEVRLLGEAVDKMLNTSRGHSQELLGLSDAISSLRKRSGE